MARPTFTHVHLSGLWDADTDQWIQAVLAAMAAGDVVTITEFTKSPISARWFRERGWGLIHYSGVGRNEGAIIFDLDVFESLGDSWCLPISTTPFALGKGTIRPRTHLTGVKLRHIASKKIVNVDVFHAPSAIEGRRGLIANARRAKAALEGFRAANKHRRSELGGQASIISADWNLNHALRWVRTLLAAAMPGTKTAWRKFAGRGTHGKRFIDGPRFSRKLVALRGGTRVGKHPAGFDHAMAVTLFGWR